MLQNTLRCDTDVESLKPNALSENSNAEHHDKESRVGKTTGTVVPFDRYQEIRGLLREWSRWRCGPIAGETAWPSITVTGTLLEGMPSTVCPTCKGEGYLTERDTPGLIGRIECPNTDCKNGKIQADPSKGKVNPAYISCTGGGDEEDPRMYVIDEAVCIMRRTAKMQSQFFVLWAEYVRNGTTEQKAERLRISMEKYLWLLDQAHGWMVQMMEC